MKKYQPIIFNLGFVILLVGAATFITGWNLSPYVYTLGAVMVAVVQLFDRYRGKNITIKRLYHQRTFAALILLLTSLFMFTTRNNEWVVCLTIGAILQLYTAFRIPQEEKKEQDKFQ